MGTGTVLVIRGEDRFSTLLREEGLSVRTLPLVKTITEGDLSGLHKCLDRLNDYAGVFVTSQAATEALIREGAAALRTYRGQILVVGNRSGELLRVAGVSFVEPAEDSVGGLLSRLKLSNANKDHFLFVRGDRSLNTITERLGAANVDEVIVYRTVDVVPPIDDIRSICDALALGEIGWVCFFSPSGVDAFQGLLKTSGSVGGFKAAAIGQTTAKRATELGYKVEYVSPRASAEAFAAGLALSINDN